MPATSIMSSNLVKTLSNVSSLCDKEVNFVSNNELNSCKSISPSSNPSGASVVSSNTGNTIEEMLALRCSKTSQNVTESVPVPSSEHVAEIVGRQGCKIKALRAKTNTYIKTPIRGESPMFVITGRKEDVQTAKREIQLAADHFSQIRARRGSGSSGSSSTASTTSVISTSIISPSQRPSNQASPKPIHSVSSSSSTSPAISSPKDVTPKPFDDESSTDLTRNTVPQIGATLLPGQIIKKVIVPYQVVGLVVGPKGSTIKRIQMNTSTYIVTPSRDSQPVFEIQGMPDNVDAAKAEIENYIMLRTTVNNQANQQQQQTASYSASSSTSDLNCQNVNENNDLYNFDIDDLKFSNLTLNSNNKKLNSSQMSPICSNNSNLFNQMATIIDDFGINKTTSSSIWPSSLNYNNSSNSNSLNQSEDSLVNSLQQAINSVRSSSSSSSSSSSTASSFSFSSSNKVNQEDNLNHLNFLDSNHYELSNIQFDTLGNKIESLNNREMFYNSFNSNMMFSIGSNASFINPTQGTVNSNNNNISSYSAASSLSTSASSSQNDIAVNSMFQHDAMFDFNLQQQISQHQQQQDFSYLSYQTNFQQKCLICAKPLDQSISPSCMLLPCRHSGYCTTCANEMTNTRDHCRLCGLGITQAIRL